MAYTEIELIVFFAPEDGEALYSQHKTWSGLCLKSWTPYGKIQA